MSLVDYVAMLEAFAMEIATMRHLTRLNLENKRR